MSENIWSVEIDEILSCFQTLDLVPARPGIPQSVFLKVEKAKTGIRFSLASEVSGTTVVKGEGDWDLKKPIFLDRRMLFPFVFTAKSYKSDKPFEFSFNETQIVVRQGRRKAMFDQGATHGGYSLPEAWRTGKTLPLDDTLRSFIIAGSSCAQGDNLKPELNCVFLKKVEDWIHVGASNEIGHFHAQVKKSVSEFKGSLAFPLFLVPFLESSEIKAIHCGEKEVILEFKKGLVWQTVPVKASKDFPMDRVIAVSAEGARLPEVFRLECAKLGRVIERFETYLTSIRREDWGMKIRGTQGEKRIFLDVTVPQSSFKEQVALENELVADFSLNWPLSKLLGTLTYFSTLKKEVLQVRFELQKKQYYCLYTNNLQLLISEVVKKK